MFGGGCGDDRLGAVPIAAATPVRARETAACGPPTLTPIAVDTLHTGIRQGYNETQR